MRGNGRADRPSCSGRELGLRPSGPGAVEDSSWKLGEKGKKLDLGWGSCRERKNGGFRFAIEELKS